MGLDDPHHRRLRPQPQDNAWQAGWTRIIFDYFDKDHFELFEAGLTMIILILTQDKQIWQQQSMNQIVASRWKKIFFLEEIIKEKIQVGGFCALSGVFILTLPIPIVVNSFAMYYKNRLWRTEVGQKFVSS